MDGFEHCGQIFDRCFCLNVMNRIEHITAVLGENIEPGKHLFSDLFRFPERKGLLGVDTPAPEGDPVTKLFFELFCIHSDCRELDRIENVEPCLEK